MYHFSIAGVIKRTHNEQYGGVALGQPLVLSGNVRLLCKNFTPDLSAMQIINLPRKGPMIPIISMNGTLAFRVMV
jgi:hypothetical protein